MSKKINELRFNDQIFTLEDNTIEICRYISSFKEGVRIERRNSEYPIPLHEYEWERSIIGDKDDNPWFFTSIDSLKEWCINSKSDVTSILNAIYKYERNNWWRMV